MIPADAFSKLFEFTGAMSVLAGVFRWPRQGSADEDAMVAEAATVVLDAVSDADNVRVIDCVTGRNLRDQVSVAEAIEMDAERELRRFDRRN